MASSSNPIAESATITSNYYDVFINHRGPDVKETLATHLFKRLIVSKLRVFLDKEVLQEGDNIPSHLKGAIRSASVHIAIFSIDYAMSSWCLNELLLMLESRKTIIPIFYGVKPSELRWTLGENGRYARSLRILEDQKTIDSQTRLQKPRYDSKTIGEWREALSQVADFKGFVVEAEACNSDDSPLVDRVVKRVLKNLPKTPLNVSKYPTGLDDKVRDFERTVLLSMQSGEKSRVVGIVGLGGVGKTTLAKEFYNRERSKYKRSCFLQNVRERAANKSLDSLQSTLVDELTHSEVQIDSTAKGIEEIRRRVSSCYVHALIILDDVDHVRQLDALVFPVKNALSSRSLILVTTRNKDVLTSFGIVETSIYKLEGLNPQHSQELFCLHAFGQPHPVALFERMTEKFLYSCQGLPLSLQVIGALLCGKDDLKYWKEQLHKISKILPEDIQSVLKISYDGLEEGDKQIFLDIACFFAGDEGEIEGGAVEDIDTCIRIWDGSGWAGWLGLRNLQNRCLVDVEENEFGKYLRMHDHVRDLGRDLADKEALRGHPVWRPSDLHNLSDKSIVRGIRRFDQSLSEYVWRYNRKRRWSLDQNPVELGNRMTRLELLATPGDCLKDILGRVQSPRYLIWLFCHSFPYDSVPRWVPMERLRVLHLEGTNLKRLWGQRNCKAPLQLRELRIMAPLLEFPKSIGQLKYLEKIVVYPRSFAEVWGPNTIVPLKTLPDEFCHLQCLEHLELNRCSELESLPDSFGNLKNLQCIILRYCYNLRMLPNSFGELIQLKHLCLRGCESLTMSNETLGSIATLEFIDMTGCTKIEVLPPQVGHQRCLETLYVQDMNLKELPNFVGDLRDLEDLELGGPSLETLPAWLGCLRSLKKLFISRLPLGSPELPQSTHFIISAGLEYLPTGIMALNNLKDLTVSEYPLKELPFKRPGGERETVTDSTRIRALGKPDECMLGLISLFLSSLKISELAFGEGVCPNLQRIRIDKCEDLVEVRRLPNTLIELLVASCSNLRQVDLRDSTEMEEHSGFATLKSLETLNIFDCGKLTSILGQPKLEVIKEKLEGFCHLILPRRFIVIGCPNLQCGEEVHEHMLEQTEEDLSDII